jgi:hypothetical protein
MRRRCAVKFENQLKKWGTADDADGADIGGHQRYQRSKMYTSEDSPQWALRNTEVSVSLSDPL